MTTPRSQNSRPDSGAPGGDDKRFRTPRRPKFWNGAGERRWLRAYGFTDEEIDESVGRRARIAAQVDRMSRP